MRGVDIIVLLDLLDRGHDDWTLRGIASDLGLPLASVHRAIDALASSTVFDGPSRRVNRSEAEHLLVDAVRFMFPAVLGAETRGVPTAWGTAPLDATLSAAGGVPVWPSPTGTVRGAAVDPLHESAIGLATSNPGVYERLALIDGLRLGDARGREASARLLRERIGARAPT